MKKAREYAQEIGALFFETSAKADSGKCFVIGNLI